MSWGYSKRKRQAYPKGSTARATSGRGSSMSGVHRRRGQDRLPSYEYSTIHRGTQKVTSEQQHELLEAQELPHTHVYDDGSRKRVTFEGGKREEKRE